MGTSKRYAHSIDARMDARIVDGIMRTRSPDSLGSKQLNLDTEPMTRTPKPKPARAWVRYGEHSIEIDVDVVAWTGRAIAVRWAGPDGSEHHAWVWAGAVSERRTYTSPS
jgi:hypothetical protein